MRRARTRSRRRSRWWRSACWQFGLALLFQAPANRWLQRTRPWFVVVVANSMIMTFYLWNMSAVVLAAVLLFPTGVAPQPEALTTGWWLLRPAWWLACAICMLPFLFGFRWAERPVDPPPPSRAGSLGPAIALLGTAVAGSRLRAARGAGVPGTRLDRRGPGHRRRPGGERARR